MKNISSLFWAILTLDANGFRTYSQTFNGIDLISRVEHTIVVINRNQHAVVRVKLWGSSGFLNGLAVPEKFRYQCLVGTCCGTGNHFLAARLGRDPDQS